MDDRSITKLLKYSSCKQLYIVSWRGGLKILFCPFKVSVIHDIRYLKKGQVVLVEKIKVTKDIITVYLIENQYFFYYHFDILDN